MSVIELSMRDIRALRSRDAEFPAYGNRPALRGSYELWKRLVEDAVQSDAPPSPELVVANEMLAAWESHLGIGRVSSFPVTTSLNITDVCNARCTFCPYVPERVSHQRISLDKLRRSDWLRFSKVFTPNGGGLGDPITHPDIDEIIAIVRELAPYIIFTMITNGSLLREKALNSLAGFARLIKFSLNAGRKETYEKTMYPLKWDKTVDNFKRLRDRKLALGTDLPTMRAGYVLHKHNIDELPELPRLLREWGFSELFINVMVPPPPSPSAGRPLMTRQDTIFEVVDLAQRRFEELRLECARHQIQIFDGLPRLTAGRGS